MAGPAPGKPLITFGDMLRDQSERRPAPQPEPDEPDSPTTIKQKKIAQLRAMFYSSDPKAATPSTGPSTSLTSFLCIVSRSVLNFSVLIVLTFRSS